MAAHHFRCRPVASANPDVTSGEHNGARLAKWRGRCATCGSRFNAGDAVSFSREREPNAPPAAPYGAQLAEEGEETAPESSAATEPAPIAPPATDLGALIGALTSAVASQVEARIRPTVERLACEASKVTRVEIIARDPSGESTVKALPGPQHKQLPTLIRLVAAGCNVWVHGEQGTGKTYAAEQTALALGYEYRAQGSIADRFTDLTGFIRPDGACTRPLLRDSYEHGGVHLIDEIDGSLDAATPLAINALLANGVAAFPDGMIKRHENFRIIACANTIGLGADANYVGRLRFDSAFLDRWVPLAWSLDEDLEFALHGTVARRVQEIRRRVRDRGIQIIISPRATERLAKCLASGLDACDAERMAIGGLMTAEQWSSVS